MENRDITKKNTFESRYFYPLIIIGVFIYAWIVQQKFFLSWDAATLLYASERMLAGGNYITDYFTPNPPMIMYFYMPVIALKKFVFGNMAIAFQSYITFLMAISFLLCSHFTGRLFGGQYETLEKFFLVILLCTFLLTPLFEFGQRDPLFYALIFPYILLTTCRLQQITFKLRYGIMTGFMGGCVLALKPYFLILPAVLELYYVINKRNWQALIKPEIVIMGAIIMAYLVVVLLTQQDYLYVVLPAVVKDYYPSAAANAHELLFNYAIEFSLCALSTGYCYRHINPYKHLNMVLSLSLFALLLIYFIQRTTYFYHMMPALNMACVLVALNAGFLVTRKEIPNKTLLRASLFPALLFLVSLAIQYKFVLTYLLFYQTNVLFIFLSVILLCSFVLRFRENSLLQSCIHTAFIITATYAFFKFIMRSPWATSYLQMTYTAFFVFLILLLALIRKPVLQTGYLVTNAILLFTTPLLANMFFANYGFYYKNNVLSPLIALINEQPLSRQSYYSFSMGTNYAFPLLYYTQARPAQRFDCLWMIKGMAKDIYEHGDQSVLDIFRSNRDKYFFLNMITEDFQTKNPGLVFVEINKKNNPDRGNYQFNYIKYFSENADFKQLWQHYHYLKTLTLINRTVDVYERTD